MHRVPEAAEKGSGPRFPSDGTPEGATPRWIVLILVAALAATLGVTANGWTLDTGIDVLGNRFVTEPGRLGELLTHDYIAGAQQSSGFWRPLVLFAYWILWRIGGGSPLAFYVANIVLHAAISVGVFFLALRFGATPRAAAAGALLFAVHPVHADVTAGVVGLKDLIAAAGFVGSLLALLSARSSSGGWRRWGTLVGVAAYLGGILGKESALALPLCLLLLDVGAKLGGRRTPDRTLLWWQYGGIAAVTALKFLLQRLLLGGAAGEVVVGPDTNPLVLLDPLSRRLHAVGLIVRSLGLLLWPARLVADYSYDAIPVLPGLLHPEILAGCLLVGLAGAAAWMWLRKGPWLAYAALALGASAYLPISNLGVTLGTNFAERFLYLPSIGFCLLAGWIVGHHRLARRTTWAIVAVLVLAGAVRSELRNRDGRDVYTLWSAVHEAYPRNIKASLSVAHQLALRGEFAPALPILEQALAQQDASSVTRPLLDYYRPALRAEQASILLEMGRVDEALVAIREAVAGPGAAGASGADPAYARLVEARVLARRGDYQGALDSLERAQLLRPSTTQAEQIEEVRRYALAALGRTPAGSDAPPSPGTPPPVEGSSLATEIESARREAAARPRDPMVHLWLSDRLYRAGDLAGAIEALGAAEALQPDNVQIAVNRGILLSESGRLSEAERVFRELLVRQPGHPQHLYNLGLVLRRGGREEEARAAWEEALLQVPATDPLRQAIRDLLPGPTAAPRVE